MKRLFFVITAILLMIITSCTDGNRSIEDNEYALIPMPATLVPAEGSFMFTSETEITLSTREDDARLAADFLSSLIERGTGVKVRVDIGTRARRGNVAMIIDKEAGTGTEGYLLKVTPSKIELKAETPAGLFYGVQTIRQLMPAEMESPVPVPGTEPRVPACEVKDSPRFVYRGMHLDVARHMFPVEYIKRYIDMLALHKMNTFHWHLTDDQGWRIEIEKYPLLTEVGGFRKETLIGHGGRPPFEYDGKPYGGYYTRDEVKEIVEYARQRFIAVIPEIEMPGHAMAALAGYPGLACTEGPFEVETRWGVFDDVFCAGKEETFLFLQDVLDEIISLFPSKYIHIGGDECPKTRWKSCPDCQQRIADEGLGDEHELQSYFIRRIENYLIAKDRMIIGW
ncbi:MAG: beta-N-acetylhexosaminidase, partial [Bacteroidales bacterium]|nr:beta-N-acetylhexosaminidase [Bacteroidales bacterium]